MYISLKTNQNLFYHEGHEDHEENIESLEPLAKVWVDKLQSHFTWIFRMD